MEKRSVHTDHVGQAISDRPLTSEPTLANGGDMGPKAFIRHFKEDQQRLWTSPFRLRPTDVQWLIPVAGATTGLLMTDRASAYEISRGVRGDLSNTISNVGLAAYGGAVAGFYLLGRHHDNARAQETGLLGVEAVANSLTLGFGLKAVFQRERPLEGDGKGHFFRYGGSSFYSVHSTVAWSVASVIASEYPGWLTQVLAYGGATAIGMARVKGKDHFPSDVFVGAVAGYRIGKSIYRRRHDPELGGLSYGNFIKSRPEWNSRSAGSTYLSLDSWIYPVLDRLIAAGLIRYQFLGLRPYTRTAVADMLAEADYRIQQGAVVSDELVADLQLLRNEFENESKLGSGFDNRAITLESMYTRTIYISGQPLNDSLHFGQTIINDFGRPDQAGYNQVIGFISRAESGRLAFYLRGEYQHAPVRAAYPLSARQAIANADVVPLPSDVGVARSDQFRLVEAYASLTALGQSVSVGKQSLWWGPGKGGAMMLSNNAEPIYMLRVNRAVPMRLPSVLKYLGPLRYDAFLGQLSEHQFPPRPFIQGQKFSFKPTENFEYGFSRTAIFAGEGLTPLTFSTFWHSFTSMTSSTNPGFDIRRSAGARHSQFDFSYRIPGLRKWLTLYSDSVVHDDVSPVAAPRRAGINPGIYVAQFPKLHRLDLRAEAVNTDPPISNSLAGRFIYYEGFYRDGYTNKGKLLGSWIGREGKGVQISSTYWLSPMSTIQISYRHAKVAKDFVPGGETIGDFALRTQFRLRPDLQLRTFMQFERWRAPVLSPGIQNNVTSSVELTFWPKQFARAQR